jgi:hypothetical protein
MSQRSILFKLPFVLAAILPAYPQHKVEYCAFEVTVRSPGGAPVAGIEVSELQSPGSAG